MNPCTDHLTPPVMPQVLLATLGPSDQPNERVPVTFVRGSFLLRFVLVRRVDNGKCVFVHDSQLKEKP